MTRHDTITLYRAPDGWRWRYTASNGRILADSGQGYSRRVDAVRGACRVVGATVYDADAVRGWCRVVGATVYDVGEVLSGLREHGEAFILRASLNDVRVVIEGDAG